MLISVQRTWHAPGVHVACDAAWRCEGGKRLSGGTFDGRMPVRICSVHFEWSAPSRRRWVLSARIRAASVRLGLAVRPVPAFAAGRLVCGTASDLGGSFACRPGTTLLSWPRPVAAPCGAPSRPGRGGAVDERARSQWPAEEEWSAALAGGRAPGRGDPLMSGLLGGRRRVHSRPAWNCSCWGRCGAWAL